MSYEENGPILYAVMDTSGSVAYRFKEQFFAATVALRDALRSRFDEPVEVRCVRHHTSAYFCKLLDFLTEKQTGGTIVSSALKLVLEDIEEKHANNDRPIYLLVMGDGDNWKDDNNTGVIPTLKKLNDYVSDVVYIENTEQGPIEDSETFEVFDEHCADCYTYAYTIDDVLSDIVSSVYVLETVRPEPENTLVVDLEGAAPTQWEWSFTLTYDPELDRLAIYDTGGENNVTVRLNSVDSE